MFFSSATSSYLELNFFIFFEKRKKKEKGKWMEIKGIEKKSLIMSYHTDMEMLLNYK